MRGGWFAGVLGIGVSFACSAERTEPPASVTTADAVRIVDARLPRTRRALTGPTTSAAHELIARFPERANEPVHIAHAKHPDIWVDVVATDVRDVPGVLADDAMVFANARRDTDMLLVADGQHVEELRVLRTKDAPTTARYELQVGPGVARMRTREGRVELLNEAGRVELLVDPPYAIDANGVRRDLDVALDGRALTLSLDPRGLQVPIVVDPGWTTVASMRVARARHGLIGFGTGKALAAGGQGPAGGLSSAEVYDATANTWTLVASMPENHDLPGIVVLGDGSILVCGGYTAPALGNCHRYNPTTNVWSNAGNMGMSGVSSDLVLLPSGNVFALAGNGNTAKYTTSTNTWITIAARLTPDRSLARAARLPSGRVLIAGGRASGFPSAATNYYDESTGLSAGPAMRAGHDGALPVVLSGGSVLVADGASAELFNPTTSTWTTTTAGGISFPIVGAALSGDAALFSNGTSATIFDNKTKLWHPVTPTTARGTSAAAGALLTSARVLVSGGGSPATPLLTAELFVQGALGQPCTTTGACVSFFCADGVCCNTACTSVCQACTAAKRGSGTNGTCGAIANGTDPDRECPASSCTAAVQNNAQVCNGAGACRTNGSMACAVGYVCNGPACATSCTSDAQCATTHYCSGTACVAKKDNGVACTATNQCKTGFCVDGVCCDTACGGVCSACTAAKKGSGADGTCAPVAADTDPDNECTTDVAYPNSCRADGMCNGMGACRAYAKVGTVCGVTTCADGKVNGRICNGTGTCDVASTPCAPYACGATACKTTCAADSDCDTTAFCTTTGACATKRSNGEACTLGRECSSGSCADGYCCDMACTGQCEACNETGNAGKCVPVTGKPRGARPACTSAGEACGGTCNGVTTTECKYPVTECGSTCEAGIQKNRVCDGTGKCIAGDDKACVAYACDTSGKCKTACTADTDCASAYHCAEGACVPGGKCSPDNTSSIAPGGAVTQCGAYRCDPTAGNCRSSCTASDQCAVGNVCNAGTKSCEAAPAATEDGGGCGCRTTTRSGSGAWLGLGLALAVVLRNRRRPATSCGTWRS